MDCPRAHEWYELERGTLDADRAKELRRHRAECDACRTEDDELRPVAASLERLAALTRVDLPASAEASLRRRGRVHGLLGRPMKRPLALRFQQRGVLKYGLATAAAVAAAVIVALVVHMSGPRAAAPAGALARVEEAAEKATTVSDLRKLAPDVEAALGEEVAQAEPSVDQVGDLVMLSYMARRGGNRRQVDDFQFLLDRAAKRRLPDATARASLAPRPMLASIVATALPAGTDRYPSPARRLLLEGRYEEAARAAGDEAGDRLVAAWCLKALGRSDEAMETLETIEAGPERAMARCLLADLWMDDVGPTPAVYEMEQLARQDARFWFAAGYLTLYELHDELQAGKLLARVPPESPLGRYVRSRFAAQIQYAERPPEPLLAEDFDAYGLGRPEDWGLIRTRSGEFSVVGVPGGKALLQDETDLTGAEFLAGSEDDANYTLQVDVRVLAGDDYVVGAAAYRTAEHMGYVMEMSPHRLRLLKQFASPTRKRLHGRPERLVLTPEQAVHTFDRPLREGVWYTLRLRIQRIGEGVSVAGKMWRRDMPEPATWQVTWTDAGQAGRALSGGLAGVQVSRAKVLIDNLVVRRNEAPAR